MVARESLELVQGSKRARRASPAVRRTARGVLFTGALVAIGLAMALPFLWMITSSFKPMREIFAYPPTLWPQSPTLDNYVTAFGRTPVARWFLNSAIVTGSITLSNVLADAMAAYAFARLRFPGKDVVFVLLLVTLMIPFHLTLVPLFLILRSLGLLNSLAGVIAPGLASILGVFLLRGFFADIPLELEEAARVDGAGEFQIFWRVAMPLARPALATVAIIVFVQSWGEFLLPLLVLNDRSAFTLPLGIRMFQGEYSTEWGQLMAVTFLADLPILVLFLMLQRHFIHGLTQGALKA
ncbi:carbohydrate ABC transporter permease [Carboxydochorda subterranea]|uniref:Carbohydrate ABC transporter permease n=1 Tax=Carboxydichorda subterranea TaxID=3109565 RepID=A0ABZ1BVL6_9FIRM|nr:carbohydrate ABC transporter permease [Limnochorda sp. L945t]WRP16576.1 carbohydrate ABC transporter permease [Limnochorda sp. L945t]